MGSPESCSGTSRCWHRSTGRATAVRGRIRVVACLQAAAEARDAAAREAAREAAQESARNNRRPEPRDLQRDREKSHASWLPHAAAAQSCLSPLLHAPQKFAERRYADADTQELLRSLCKVRKVARANASDRNLISFRRCAARARRRRSWAGQYGFRPAVYVSYHYDSSRPRIVSYRIVSALSGAG
jgi:hypothetical protein